MKKQNFNSIIALMGISLIGIIAMQLIWMMNAINIKEDQFDQMVNRAIIRAAYRIERNQNAFFISSMYKGDRNKQNNTIKQVQPKIDKQIKNGIETITYGFDTTIYDGNLTQSLHTYSSYSRANVNENAENFEQIKSQFGDIMQQMAFELTIRDLPIEERLSQSVIKPTVEYELKLNGVPLSFEYAIADHGGQIFQKLSTAGFNIRKAKNVYKTTLFPNDIIDEREQLFLYFPDKASYIYSSMIWQISGSLLFTIIVLITFFYTLKIIMNQKRVSEIKTDFINNMTHEFKTPIATISLAADSITNPLILNDNQKVLRFTNIIKEENRRMNRQVESVLQMALIDKKEFNLNLQDCNLHPIIEKAVNNITIQIEQKQGTIKTELLAHNDIVRIDKNHIENVIFNLIDNANKYSLNAPPEITVSTHKTGNDLYISVSDKGIGMDKETQERAFEKFYRHSTGNVHTVKGFGMGLSYVKAIVMAHKGTITIKSQKGIGSTFTIKLPLRSIY